MTGTLVEAPHAEPLPMTLLDGSRVVLDPDTRLSLMTLLPNDIRLQLERGRIDLDVTHVEGRRFVVVAAGYEVTVVGTRFTVRRDDGPEAPALEVRVARGRVRVTRIGDPADARSLGEGETWSAVRGGDAGSGPASAPAPAASALPILPMPEDAGAPEVSPPPQAPRPGAKELWAEAERARAAKRFQDEASALDALRRRHRSDPRAGLAAFELGRLRQDTLRDPAGAAEAFADAAVLAPNGPFREDADARRVEALDAAGRHDACLEARTAFLGRYPSGIHRPRVAVMCATR